MMVFIQFEWQLIQQKQSTVILITGSVLLVNKISFYQLRISCPPGKPLVLAGSDLFVLKLLFSLFISFERHPPPPSLFRLL